MYGIIRKILPRYISFLKDELKERNNFVFGMAIEIHGRITASGERLFLLKSKNTQLVHDTS